MPRQNQQTSELIRTRNDAYVVVYVWRLSGAK